MPGGQTKTRLELERPKCLILLNYPPTPSFMLQCSTVFLQQVTLPSPTHFLIKSSFELLWKDTSAETVRLILGILVFCRWPWLITGQPLLSFNWKIIYLQLRFHQLWQQSVLALAQTNTGFSSVLGRAESQYLNQQEMLRSCMEVQWSVTGLNNTQAFFFFFQLESRLKIARMYNQV